MATPVESSVWDWGENRYQNLKETSLSGKYGGLTPSYCVGRTLVWPNLRIDRIREHFWGLRRNAPRSLYEGVRRKNIGSERSTIPKNGIKKEYNRMTPLKKRSRSQ